ncbi:MAG TPA: hypothetical protein VMV69_04835 [Pirellulales bacterium]|nr:hypothetical protein [Pirellulales bacterium]
MAWETRNGRGRYYTRSRRRNGRVVREYVGTGEMAKLSALMDEHERARRKAVAEASQAALAEMQAVETVVAEFCQLVDRATRFAFVANGYHQHHRGEWRKKRDEQEEGTH